MQKKAGGRRGGKIYSKATFKMGEENMATLPAPSKSHFGSFDGQLVGRGSGGGWGGLLSSLQNEFRISVSNLLSFIKSIVGKNQKQNGQLLLSGFLKRELPQ